MKKTFLFLIILMTAAFSGCGGSSSPAPTPEPTKEELLVKVTWKISEVSVNGTKDNTTDYSSYRITFSTSGKSYSRTYAGQTQPGTWELSSDGGTLTLDKGKTNEVVMTVQKLTSTNLDVAYSNKDFKNGTQNIVQKMIPA